MRKWNETYWIVQALLAVNPDRPKWANVMAHAVAGNKEVKGRIKDYWIGRFWTDAIAWQDEDMARREFGKLAGFKQEYDLRLLRVHTTVDEAPVTTIRTNWEKSNEQKRQSKDGPIGP
jgi:hypothetical protein